MCGELDENVHINAEIRDRLRIIARKVGVWTDVESDPGPLVEEEPRAAYTERVFREALAATLADVEGAEADQKIDVIASRAIAFARLAGFLAGQLPPEADLFRGVIETLTEGHAEPRRIAARLRAEADHHHHHHHGGEDHPGGHDHGDPHHDHRHHHE